MPGFANYITVVRLSEQFPLNDVLWAVGALNKQIIRDFGPIWDVSASVDVAESLDLVTPGKWKIALVDNIKGDTLKAFHGWAGGIPFALVEYSKTWTVSLSHEVLEMLADPFGKHRVAAQSLASDQGRVEYLVEVCDPCQSDSHAYRVDGVLMSDFYTRNYFDPFFAPGVRYSFYQPEDSADDSPSIPRPRNVPKGGYLTWFDPATEIWWQYDNMGAAPEIIRVKAPSGVLERRTVDRLTMRREKAFWKRRHELLPSKFDPFDRSFFNGNDLRTKKLMKALKKKV
jgi:hypothetical protein